MTILVLGAGEGQLPLIQRAKVAGWYVIVVSPKGDYPGFLIADENIYADISDKDTVLTIARDFSVDAVATDQTDVSVPSVQFVAEKLNLPHIQCRDIENFRIKPRMRQLCEKAGIPTIPHCVTSDYATALSFYRALSDDAIIKPIDSQGSRGVHLINTIDVFDDAFSDALSYSKNGTIIIEKFIEGQEIEVDTIVNKGAILSTIIGDVFKFDVKDAFSSYERIYPSALSHDILQKVSGQNEQVLRVLGLYSGWSHGEYIVSNDGEIYLLEVGARGGGNYVGSEIVRLMCGVGTDEMAFRSAIGDMSFYDEVQSHNVFCAIKNFYLPEGEVASLCISEDLFSKEYVVRHNLDHLKVGMKVLPNTDKTSRFTIVLKADTRERLRQYLSEVTQMIQVEVTDADGQKKGVIWE